jgi:hypothetical protein
MQENNHHYLIETTGCRSPGYVMYEKTQCDLSQVYVVLDYKMRQVMRSLIYDWFSHSLLIRSKGTKTSSVNSFYPQWNALADRKIRVFIYTV